MNASRVLAMCLLAVACRREDISVRREAKEAPQELASSAPSAPSRGLRWTTPAGWTQQAGGNMRVAAFRLPSPSEKAEATVATFPGDVGGELANVNRWRGQIALPPVEEGALSSLRARVESPAGTVLLYDFTGAGEAPSRLVAGMVRTGESTWFFKLNGPVPAVAAARPAFVEMLKGLRDESR